MLIENINIFRNTKPLLNGSKEISLERVEKSKDIFICQPEHRATILNIQLLIHPSKLWLYSGIWEPRYYMETMFTNQLRTELIQELLAAIHFRIMSLPVFHL
jgi:hypothetical protein